MIQTLYPIFRKWSERGSVYIISDTHFDDEDRKVMGYSISEEEQVSILKKRCHKTDTLIHLGDVGNPEYLKEIKSYKVLIMGNHDESVSRFEEYFDEIYTGPLWIAEKIVLSHESIEVRGSETQTPVAINIHGHNHAGPVVKDNFHFNIAQNVYGYVPLNLKEFIKEGHIKNIKSIHRNVIDNATKRKRGK